MVAISYRNNYTIDRTFCQTYKRTFDFDIYLPCYPYLGAAYKENLHDGICMMESSRCDSYDGPDGHNSYDGYDSYSSYNTYDSYDGYYSYLSRCRLGGGTAQQGSR